MANDIREREDVDTSGTFYTIGYSSPWVMDEAERRNEVWIEKVSNAQRFTSPASFGSQGDKQTSDELTELLPPEFIERGMVSIFQIFTVFFIQRCISRDMKCIGIRNLNGLVPRNMMWILSQIP